MKVSYIIPHKNRHGILTTHLKLLNQQSYENFEVIVVDDGSDTPYEYPEDNLRYKLVIRQIPESKGANHARNHGVEWSSGEVVLIVGDDNFPHHHLIATHAYEHLVSKENIVVQGVTPFHPDVMDTVFMQFLDKSGIQANWASLRDSDGWKREIPGFCLTTNLSMKKDLFHTTGGFDESFVRPAWDDIDFGIRLQKLGIKTVFNPQAINLHVHKYDLQSFAARQFMEGMNRINLCMIHPEMGHQLINPEGLRQAETVSQAETLSQADWSLKSIAINEDVVASALQHSSHLGILKDIESRSRQFQVLKHIHTGQSVFAALNGLRALEDNNMSYAFHCAGWLIDSAPENWAVYAFAGDIYSKYGKKEEAILAYQKSISIAPNDWSREGVESLIND
jgi:GT2 family glycosyltransferase